MYRPQELDVFIYLRKSRKDLEEEKKVMEHGQHYDTLERHRTQLLELAHKEHHNIIDIFEEVVSGEYISERPMMQKLLREVETGIADAVLVMDLDRLGRGDMVDQGTIYRVFRYSETFIITPTEVINPNDENQELTFSIKSLIAREELKTIVKRMQRGRRASAKEGKSISRVPPYGYLRDNNLKLYPDPEKSWVISKIFELMARGTGRQAIAQELDRLGLAPPEGEYWNPSTISSIIKNEVYLGHIIWGKIRYTKQNGKYSRKKVSKERWQRHDNAHPPLVSEELFQRANTAHSKRWRPPTIKTKKLSNPLAGILLCELCGHSMLYQPRKDRPNPQVRCIQPSCKGIQKGAALALVEQRILDGLKQIIENFEIQENMIQKKKSSNNIHLQQKALEKKEQQINDLQKQKGNLHDLLEKSVYDVDTFFERQKSITARLKTTKEEIEELKHEVEKILEKEKHLHEFVPKVKNVLEAYFTTSHIERKNLLLKSVLEKVTYLRKKEWKRKDEFIVELYTKI
ncbi:MULTISPECIES: recombinase family protein [Bacillus cereus group]|uniref:Recombinase n=2 Tax=Bacillus cereus group TaxID=86661 RepID=A0A1C4A037_BACTU|nr:MULTISPECIES: recombinase family protein [Bacillus cereus group]MED3026365.1 recombinase family protein [Bacillus wiedmannii]OTX97413.1 recombinase [Bacillus thuringiensis serovar wratislaviensis]OUB62087.1 recombinase [Bacillus thuringiensis serovar sylvestriensis]SCB87921.1 Recombinase [Bacillus thuringiensis]